MSVRRTDRFPTRRTTQPTARFPHETRTSSSHSAYRIEAGPTTRRASLQCPERAFSRLPNPIGNEQSIHGVIVVPAGAQDRLNICEQVLRPSTDWSSGSVRSRQLRPGILRLAPSGRRRMSPGRPVGASQGSVGDGQSGRAPRSALRSESSAPGPDLSMARTSWWARKASSRSVALSLAGSRSLLPGSRRGGFRRVGCACFIIICGPRGFQSCYSTLVQRRRSMSGYSFMRSTILELTTLRRATCLSATTVQTNRHMILVRETQVETAPERRKALQLRETMLT